MKFLVNLDVDDLDRAASFYSSALGLEVGRRFGVFGVEMLGGDVPKFFVLTRPSRGFCDEFSDGGLVFPKLFKKSGLIQFLKHGKIHKTFGRRLLCLRLLFRHLIQDKFYSLERWVRNFLESCRVKRVGVVQ
jgi:hypothetical protein